jgi:hypothetical protein
MNIREIVTEHLKSIKADGLACIGVECGCGLDDLMPCDYLSECVPAKKVMCKDCSQPNACPYESSDGPCYFAIKETK